MLCNSPISEALYQVMDDIVCLLTARALIVEPHFFTYFRSTCSEFHEPATIRYSSDIDRSNGFRSTCSEFRESAKKYIPFVISERQVDYAGHRNIAFVFVSIIWLGLGIDFNNSMNKVSPFSPFLVV